MTSPKKQHHVKASVDALSNKQCLTWPSSIEQQIQKRGYMELPDWLRSLFVFQRDNARNQREHLILLLADSHTRLHPKPESLNKAGTNPSLLIENVSSTISKIKETYALEIEDGYFRALDQGECADSVSSLAWFMSNQETSFVTTIGQRVLARPLNRVSIMVISIFITAGLLGFIQGILDMNFPGYHSWKFTDVPRNIFEIVASFAWVIILPVLYVHSSRVALETFRNMILSVHEHIFTGRLLDCHSLGWTMQDDSDFFKSMNSVTKGHVGGGSGGTKRKRGASTSTGSSNTSKAKSQKNFQYPDAAAKKEAKIASDAEKALNEDKRGSVCNIELSFSYIPHFDGLKVEFESLAGFTLHCCRALKKKKTKDQRTSIELPVKAEDNLADSKISTGVYKPYTYVDPAPDLKMRMERSWPALRDLKENAAFWLHEWLKHGIILTLHWSCTRYFEEAVGKAEGIIDHLNRQFIRLKQHRRTYTLNELYAEMTEVFNNAPKIQVTKIDKHTCRLKEIGFMFTLPNQDGQWVMTDFVEELPKLDEGTMRVIF